MRVCWQGNNSFRVKIKATTPKCVRVGEAITAPVVTMSSGSQGLADLARSQGITSISGTVTVPYTVSGAVAAAGDRTMTLTIEPTPVPTSGAMTITASGFADAEIAAGTPGPVQITMGDSTAAMNSVPAKGNPPHPVTGTAAKNTTATITVMA